MATMLSARPLVGGLLGAVALLLLLIGTHSQMHTQIETFDDTCDAQLQSLWSNYTSPPVAPVAGCNATCLAACYTTLNWAIYSERKQNCPTQAEIISCMHVYRAQWVKFVSDCALFKYGVSVSAEAEGEAGSSSSSSSSEGEASEGEASEGEASSEGSAPAEGAEGEASAEGAAPAAPASAAEGEASSEAEGEATEAGRRRVLLQEAEASLSGNSTDVSNGCFPTFQSAAEFVEYINGEYVFTSQSSAVGIALSVLFYVSLLLMGAGLPKFIKAPFGKLKATLFGCGRRSKVQRLEPPQQAQQAEVAGEAQAVSGQAVAREEAAGFPPADKPSAPAVA